MKRLIFYLFLTLTNCSFILPVDSFTILRKSTLLLSCKSESPSSLAAANISINPKSSNYKSASNGFAGNIISRNRMSFDIGIPFDPSDRKNLPTQTVRKNSNIPVTTNRGNLQIISLSETPSQSQSKKKQQNHNNKINKRKLDEGELVMGKSSGHWPSKLSRSIFQESIRRLVHRWSVEPPQNLNISSSPARNIVGRLLFNGEVASDIRITFERLCLRNLFISGGGCLEVKELSMNLCRFMPKRLRRILQIVKYGPKNPRLFASSFDIHMIDCIIQSQDLISSSCVTVGLSNLFKRVLNSFEFIKASEVFIRRIEILPSMKISCKGVARTRLGTNVPFEVRSSIGICGGGHVMTFPGLEISVNPYLQVFVPVPNITLDIGHNAKIETLEIDKFKRQIKLSAQVTIIPSEKRKLTYKQRRSSYLAQYHYDAAAWLTRAGNFTQ